MKSEKRDSNPPPTAWKAVALPDELLPPFDKKEWVISYSFFSWEDVDSNHGRLSQQIYSLPHLTALVSSLISSKIEPMDGVEPPTG